MKKQYMVVGLGRFGAALARTLEESGSEVMAIDANAERLSEVAQSVTHAVQMDATDADALVELGVRNFDVAIITIGGDIEASTVATMLIKEQGVGRVIAKAQSEMHARILAKVGADKVIFPERDMGRRMAHNLISGNILEFIHLSSEYSLSEIQPLSKWVGKSLVELNLRAAYKINVIAIRSGEKINISPHAEDVIRAGDVLVVVGSIEGLRELERRA